MSVDLNALYCSVSSSIWRAGFCHTPGACIALAVDHKRVVVAPNALPRNGLPRSIWRIEFCHILGAHNTLAVDLGCAHLNVSSCNVPSQSSWRIGSFHSRDTYISLVAVHGPFELLCEWPCWVANLRRFGFNCCFAWTWGTGSGDLSARLCSRLRKRGRRQSHIVGRYVKLWAKWYIFQPTTPMASHTASQKYLSTRGGSYDVRQTSSYFANAKIA